MSASRIRTIFQSLDTARYQKDGSEERFFDTAHARSEALSALLFGHEIIVPAGAVADCPAFIELFAEVMGPADEYRTRMSDESGDIYRPFRIALERRFDKGRGQGGYDAFIEDYRQSFTLEAAGNVDLVSIGDLDDNERRAARQQKERVSFLVDAFLAKKWSQVRAVSETYADHIQRVYSEFSPRSAFSAEPAWASSDLISELPADYYKQRIQALCNELEKRSVPIDGVEKVRAAAASVQARLPNPALRGQWYKNGAWFEEHWPIVRTWLDQGLYRIITASFEIALPSLFLQEIDDDEAAAQAALVFLSEKSVLAFTDEVQRGKLPLPPVPADVKWRQIWELISEPEFQRSTERLQFELADAYRNERARRREARAGAAGENAALERSYDRIAADRQRRVVAAVASHIEMMNAGQSKLVFERDADGRLTVSTKKSGEGGAFARSTALTVLGTGAAMAIDAVGVFSIGVPVSTGGGYLLKFGMKVGDRLTGARVDEAISHGTDWAIDRVKRSQPVADADSRQVGTIEQKRVNLWLRPE